MADYTPTTEEARDFYSATALYKPDAHAAWNRWLAQHDAEVRAEVIDWIETEADAEVALCARVQFEE